MTLIFSKCVYFFLVSHYEYFLILCFNISSSHFLLIHSEQIPETMGPPHDLSTSEVTAKSFRVSWSQAPGNVDMYRVIYHPAQGREPQEVFYMCFVLFWKMFYPFSILALWEKTNSSLTGSQISGQTFGGSSAFPWNTAGINHPSLSLWSLHSQLPSTSTQLMKAQQELFSGWSRSCLIFFPPTTYKLINHYVSFLEFAETRWSGAICWETLVAASALTQFFIIAVIKSDQK